MASYRQQGYRPQPAAASRNGRGRANGAGAAASRARGKPRKRKRGRPFRMFLLLVTFAVLATVGVMGYQMYEQVGQVERENTFYPGVYIDGIELYGMTPEASAQMLYDRALSELSTFSINLYFGTQEWVINAETLGMTASLDQRVREEVNKAFMVGREDGSIIERYQTISALQEVPYQGYTSGVDRNMSPIDLIVGEIQNVAYIAPKDATQQFDTTRNYAHVVYAEEDGREVNGTALKARIVQMVNEMQSGEIWVETTPLKATITKDMLEGDMVRIADVWTPINRNSTPERTMNVALGCSKFDGMYVKPGEVVSFNKVTGKRTLKNGYHEALEIVSGEYEMGVGGGICQVSSTLYNAVIQAGLEVLERTNHGIPVNYIEKGLDATVSDERHDFRFKNNTDKPIMIVARIVTEGREQRCQFQIYGRPIPNDYRYSIRAKVIEEIPIPSPTKVPDKKVQYVRYLDESLQVTDGSVGYKVQRFLVTKDAAGNVINEVELPTDTYEPIVPKIYVGVERRP